ncbi:MAG TPA: hypothetical protein VI256_19875 [Roseiarcus sp.]
MIRTLVITVLCGLAASPAALAIPDPTALGASIDKATPKKANDRNPLEDDPLFARATGEKVVNFVEDQQAHH